MDFDKLTNILSESCLTVIPDLSNELLETLKRLENCADCKNNRGKYNLDELRGSINEIENLLASLERAEEGLEQEWLFNTLAEELFRINKELNRKVLCESCKGKEIEKSTDQCQNEEIAKLLYESKLNVESCNSDYVEWIPFKEIRIVEYLAKGDFGEVHMATRSSDNFHGTVVLIRIYNSVNKILKEVKFNSLNEIPREFA